MVPSHARRLLDVIARPNWQKAFTTLTGQRSAAQDGDKILLQGLVFHGYHGVLQGERDLGQKFVVDATLAADLSKAGLSDNLSDTIDYASVYEDIKTIVEGNPRQLIESVAEDIAKTILVGYPGVDAVHVRVRKPHVAVNGVLDALGVEITRYRKD